MSLIDSSFSKTFKEKAQEIIKQHDIPGLTIGISQDNEKIYEQGFGFRNREQQLPINNDTICGIASITKSFTCVAVMKLQEMNKLSVKDYLTDFIPELKSASMDIFQHIKIHHLMTHSAGLPPFSASLLTMKESLLKDPSAKDYPGLDLLRAKGDPINSFDEYIEHIVDETFRPLGNPGEAFSYSNDSYTLLGAIIERVSGKTYEQFVHENILEPARMHNSFFSFSHLNNEEHLTTLYAKKKNGDVYPTPFWWESDVNGAGGLKSTVNDLLKYAQIFLNDGQVDGQQILTKDSVEAMVQPHIKIEPNKYYGYGFMIATNFHGLTLIEHGGSTKGVASLFAMIPELNVATAALTNLAGVPTDKIVIGALNLINDLSFAAESVDLSKESITKEQLKDYVGSYTSSEGASIEVKIEEERLVLYNNNVPQPLTYVGNDMFTGIVKSSTEIIQFLRSKSGVVERISYHYRQIFKD